MSHSQNGTQGRSSRVVVGGDVVNKAGGLK